MFGSLFDSVVGAIYSWTPSREYSREEKYRDDLIKWLKRKLVTTDLLLGQQHRVKVVKESGRHLCDIGVEESIGVELKRNLKKVSQVDRLRGQLERFLRQYSDIVVVLVGETGESAHEELLDHVEEITGGSGLSVGLSEPQRVKVIDKGGEEEEEKRSPEDLGDLEGIAGNIIGV